MSNQIINKIRDKHELIFKVLLFAVSIFLVVLLLPKEGKFKYEFQKNKPWVHEDLLAPFGFAINKSKEEIATEKIKISQNQLLYFNVNAKVIDKVIIDFQNYIEQNVNNTLDLKEKEIIIQHGIKYLNEIYAVGIIEISDEIADKDRNFTILLMDENKVGEEVEVGKLFTIKSAYDFVSKDLKKLDFINANFLLSGIENALQQNIKYNKELTQKDLENEINNISLVKGGVYENEKIISTGELVLEDKYAVLQSLKVEYESKLGNSNQSMWILLGQLIIVILLFYAIYNFLKNVNVKVFNDNMDISFLFIVVVSFVTITVLILSFKEISVYVIPYCIIPLLIRTFFGNRMALFIYIITIFLISFIVPNSFEFILLESITGIITIFTVLNVNKRSELFYTSFIIFIVFSLSYLGLSLLQEGNIKTINWSMFGWFGMAAGFTIITYPFIYLFEKLFGYISDVTLLELSDTNNALLRELNLKAPGTFQHSLQVSNLAEEAIREIGGNPLLVRAGALYHDIGKMLAPAYFIENQMTGINPHDELSFEESADIIISHVIKGIEIAKANKLPEHIIDFIRTHHGTTKTQYFLRMSKNENPEIDIDAELFQYPGPIPFSKETAVLMMADSVEAASRSLKLYNTDSISQLVENIITSQVNENQFINTDITFNDIATIKNLFIKKMLNIYHVRIEYPK
ncbi:MAG: phosphohydrolase [Flavobacteriales bacterium CG_4_10_14_0_2_um_filter_32_8]|nr:MAG: phosphohydrolase [Flavobacteriales bacterium CG_4_10_14_0_2_um_filter_32_8]PJB15881.1 MAG: phosphohydrolase [Flavobacteriales bacterium CG_4_9_14_3_um_filter_32_8]